MASVTGVSDTSVTWAISGLGSIDATGKYTAPPQVPYLQLAFATATSVAKPGSSTRAIVILAP